MELKGDLQECISQKSWRKFPAILGLLGNKPFQSSKLLDSLDVLSHSQQNKMWKSILDFVTTNLLEINKENEEFLENIKNYYVKAEDSELFQTLILLASAQVKLLLACKKARIPEQLTQFVIFVGTILRILEGDLQTSGLDLCEQWILHSLDKCQEISPDTFIILIGKSVEEKAKKQCVKQVWALRKCLSLLSPSLGDTNDHALNQLLLSCAEASVYLSCDEGLKFLSLVMGMPKLTKSFHEVVKTCLPKCSKAQATKYAQIYFRTWRACQTANKKIIEDDCLQDLMYHVIHVDRNLSLSGNLFAFLSYIHRQNKHQPTASMIYSLYEPFLWRSLNVTNCWVRLNATTILCDAFPLSDIAVSKEDNENLLEKQYHAMITLLTDHSHHVRIAVIKGLFSILCNYWLVVPSHIIQKMFNIILSKLICDASTPEVRIQVVKGVSQLLEVTEATPFLVNVLPHIVSSFDDINSSARLACIRLLEQVKLLNITKFYELVPFEHLLHNICDDPATRSATIHLVKDIFFPLQSGEKEMLQSCITLVEMNREASHWFYQQVGKSLDIETASRFMSLIWRAISKYVSITKASDNSPSTSTEVSSRRRDSISNQRGVRRRNKKAQRGQNKENKAPDGISSADSSKEDIAKEEESRQLSLDDPEIVLGLLDTIVVLWTGKFHVLSLPENHKYIDGLQERLSKTYPLVWGYFKDSSDISKTLIYLASFLPSNLVSTVAGLCLSHISSLTDSQVPEEDYACFLNALCSWNRVDDIIELITTWIEKAFNSVSKVATPQKNAKKVCFQEATANPILALSFLRHLLKHPLNKIALLHKNRHLLRELWDTMSRVKEYLDERVLSKASLSTLCSDKFLLACWRDFLCITNVLHQTEDSNVSTTSCKRNQSDSSANLSSRFNSVKIFEQCRAWIKDELLNKENQASDNSTSAFILELFSVFVNATMSHIAIDAADLSSVHQSLTLTEEIIASCGFHHSLTLNSIQLIIESHKYLSVYETDKNHDDPNVSCTQKTFASLLTHLSNHETLPGLSQKESMQLSTYFEILLQTLCSSKDLLPKVTEDLVKLTLKCLCNQFENSGELCIPEYNTIKDLTDFPKLVMLSIHKRGVIIEAFIGAIRTGIRRLDLDICQTFAALVLLSALEKERGKLSFSSWKATLLAIDGILEKLSLDSSSSDGDKIQRSLLMDGDKSEFVGLYFEKSKDLLGFLKRELAS